MAFKIRCEFWRLSTTNDGIATVMLDQALSDAIEIAAATSSPVTLPTLNGNTYAMSVEGLTGTAVVEVAKTPTQSQARGRRINKDGLHWFKVSPGSKIYVQEYSA